MSEPTAGKQYTVVVGDTLSGIAQRAYGRGSKWPVIYNANQTKLRSNNPDLIYPGEVIFIPELVDEKKMKRDITGDTLEGREANDFTLIIDGIELPVESGKVLRTMDTAADGWTASIAWTPGADPKLDQRLRPYTYPKAYVYLGGQLVISGRLYTVEPSLESGGQRVGLEGWSFTADVIDSTTKPPYEKNKVTLEQRAKDLCEPLGISVEFEDSDAKAKNKKFDRVTIDPTETIFSHLAKIAAQCGLLVSSTIHGDLLFTRAKVSSKSVGTLEEGKSGVPVFQCKFDGRKRFNSYRVISDSPKKSSKNSVSKDNRVPTSRFITFKADENNEGGIKDSAEWRRSKQIIEAFEFDFEVNGWHAPNGKLWEANSIVTIKSQTMWIPDGFNFLITKVGYSFSSSGASSTLTVTLPNAYTGESIIEPW